MLGDLYRVSDDCEEINQIECTECNMSCWSQQCYERHLKHCKLFWRCPTCKAVLSVKKRKPEQHTCVVWLCSACNVYQMGNHQCYLRIREQKQPIKRFIFFDFEAREENGKHIANFVILLNLYAVIVKATHLINAIHAAHDAVRVIDETTN